MLSVKAREAADTIFLSLWYDQLAVKYPTTGRERYSLISSLSL